jgi:hypothetical protein
MTAMPNKTFIVTDAQGEPITTFLTDIAEAMLLAPRRPGLEIQEHEWRGDEHVAERICMRRGESLWQPV